MKRVASTVQHDDLPEMSEEFGEMISERWIWLGNCRAGSRGKDGAQTMSLYLFYSAVKYK